MAREDINGIRNVEVTDADGIVLEKFNFGCTGIRSLKGMIQGLWSLNPFSQALSGRNGFSDVDGHTEIDGRGLVLEFKSSFRGMNRGQLLKAIRQAKYQKTCTWFIEGSTDKPTRIFCINETGVEGFLALKETEEITLSLLQEKIKIWESWARRHSMVKGNKSEEWTMVSEILKKI